MTSAQDIKTKDWRPMTGEITEDNKRDYRGGQERLLRRKENKQDSNRTKTVNCREAHWIIEGRWTNNKETRREEREQAKSSRMRCKISISVTKRIHALTKDHSHNVKTPV